MIELDLASLESVRACANALMWDGSKFDIIIANAGVMACPKGKTADGFEIQFGTNHLGHFVLINRIASLLKPGGRLVNLASAGHRFSDFDLDDPNFDHTPYAEFAYGRSKTANILFAVEFGRRHRANGIRATASGAATPFEFVQGGHIVRLTLPSPFSVTGTETFLEDVRLGLGLAQLPLFHVERDLAEGRLERVLHDHPLPPAPVSILYPRNRQLSPRVRLFIDWAVGQFARVSELLLPLGRRLG